MTSASPRIPCSPSQATMILFPSPFLLIIQRATFATSSKRIERQHTLPQPSSDLMLRLSLQAMIKGSNNAGTLNGGMGVEVSICKIRENSGLTSGLAGLSSWPSVLPVLR